MKGFKGLFLVVLVLGFLSGGQVAFGQTISDFRLHAAQIATGWQGTPGQPGSTEWRTEISAFNLTDHEVVVSARIFDDKGRSLTSRIFNSDKSELVPGYGFGFNLLSGKSNTSTLQGCDCKDGSLVLITGSLLLRVSATWNPATSLYEPDVAISVVYKQLDYQGHELTAAGVNVDSGGTRYVVQAMITGSLDNGVAILNPEYPGFQSTWGPIKLKLELYNFYGPNSTSPVAVKELTLQPGEKVSQFVSQLFPNLPLDVNGFPLTDGNLKIFAERPVAVTALKAYFYPGSFIIAGVPVATLKF